MIDRIQIIHEALTTASPLATAIGSRAYSPIAHKSWDASQKAIVYHQEAGTSHQTGATLTGTYIFKLYGGDDTYTSSRTLFGLLYDRLQMMTETFTSGTIISAKLESDLPLPIEADTKAKPYMARFSIQFEG